MKTAILVILVIISIISYWVIEPFSINPMHQLKNSIVDSKINYQCDIQESRSVAADTKLKQYMDANKFLGISIGFSKEQCLSYIASSGFSNKKSLEKMAHKTISRIASITKPMTAIAIMQLYEKGLIELDSPIQTYLPSFPTQTDAKITIRNLLNHTAGIPHYKSKLDAVSFSNYQTLESATDVIIERGLASEPGKQYIYSSFGYTILGNVIEKVSGMNYEEYMKKNIWEKAGMEHTSLERSHSLTDKSRLYLKAGSIYIRSPYSNLSLIYPAGGVQSTAKDLLMFGNAILNNRLISKQSLELMSDISDSLSPIAGDDPYGLGWSVHKDSKNGKLLSHSGSQPGASAYFEINLDKKTVVVALSNAFGTKNSVYNLSKEISDLLQ